MKKLISVLICLSMILSAVPMVSQAQAVEAPVFVDFEDYTSGTTYKEYVSLSLKENETASLPNGDGKSIRLYSPLDVNSTGGKDKDNYINFQSTLTSNAVFGFSCLTYDSQASFSLSSKGLGNVWGDSAVSGFLTISGTSVKVSSNEVYTNEPGAWLDVVLAMDYTNHKIYVYINRELVETYTMKDAVIGTEYFNINIHRKKYTDAENAEANFDAASIYFDNIFVYYPPTEITASVSGDMVDSKNTDEITVSFGQNVLSDDYTAAASLNGEPVETEAVEEHGYVTGIKLRNLSLAGSTEYEISFNGIKDFFGNNIEHTYSFTTASTDPVISISCDNADMVYPADTAVSFKISSANLDGNPIVICNNDEILDTIGADSEEFTVILKGGTNNIYAEVPALDVKSETISIEAEAYGVIGEIKVLDFNGGSTAGAATVSAAKGIIEVRQTDEEHDKSLYMQFDGAANDMTAANYPFIVADTVLGKLGTYVFEAEYNFSQVDTSGNFFAMKTNRTEKNWNSMFKIENGNIKTTSTQETIYSGLQPETWYKLKAVYHFVGEDKCVDFYVNDVMVLSGLPLANKDFESIQYINNSVNAKKGETVWMMMDNIKSYFIAKLYNVTADYAVASDTEVPYENAAINLTFDMEMNPETLKGIRLVDEAGTETTVDFVSEDNLTFTATVPSLKPNTNYTIDLTNAQTSLGVGGNKTAVTFKTEKLPFAIDSANAQISGNKVNVTVNIKNDNAENKSYIVVAGLYDDILMYGSDAKALQSGTAETVQLSVTKPNGDYSVEVYIFDTVEGLNLIDKLVIE